MQELQENSRRSRPSGHMTQKWRQNAVATSFLRHDAVNIAACARWGNLTIMSNPGSTFHSKDKFATSTWNLLHV